MSPEQLGALIPLLVVAGGVVMAVIAAIRGEWETAATIGFIVLVTAMVGLMILVPAPEQVQP